MRLLKDGVFSKVKTSFKAVSYGKNIRAITDVTETGTPQVSPLDVSILTEAQSRCIRGRVHWGYTESTFGDYSIEAC